MDQQPQPNDNAAAASPEHTIMFERAPLSVPLNLGEWVEPERLARWVTEAVSHLDPTRPEVVKFQHYPAAERPEAILRVLLLAYCTQVYSAAEIVRACHSEPVFRGLCEQRAVFPDELDRFLHKNRLLLENLLGQLLVRAVQEKFIHQGQLPPGLQHSLQGRAGDRVLTALLMDDPER